MTPSESDEPETPSGPNSSQEPDPGADQPEYFSGERERRVPKGAWWVLGIACVLLLSLLVVRPTWFTRAADDNSLHVPSDRHFTKTLAGLGHADGLWLNDDTSSTSFTVRLPVDSELSQTRVHLVGETQVPQDSTTFLSILADGDQVYRRELNRGTNPLDEYIDLPEGTVDDGSVRIQMRLHGSLNNQTCATDHESGADIHIGPDTVVEAALSEPVHTVRDVVSSWDRDVTLVVPDEADPWRTAAAQVGVALVQAGHEVRYAAAMPDEDRESAVLVGPGPTLAGAGWESDSTDPVAAGTVGDAAVLGIRDGSAADIARLVTGPLLPVADGPGDDPRKVPATSLAGDTIALDDLGADLSTASITEDHTWRVSYSLADLPGGRLPRAIRAAWQLPASPADLTWILTTSLNGRLIDSRRLTGGPSPVIPLPPGLERVDNTVTFTVQRDRNLGGCDVRETAYSMALDPTSALLLGDDRGEGFVALPKILAPGFNVYVTAGSGESTVDALNASVPVVAAFVQAGHSPDFVWEADPPAAGPFVQIGTSRGVSTPVSVADGRLVSESPVLDVSTITNGVVVSCGMRGGTVSGLVVQPVGTVAPAALPVFGTESAQIVTTHGSVAVNADGTPAVTGAPRANAPG